MSTWLKRLAEFAFVCTLMCSGPMGLAEETEKSPDRQVLIDLYQATGGESWTRSDGWLTTSPIKEWFGVTVKLGRVRALDLSNNNLSGPLPPSLNQLDELKSIDFRWNSLSGDIPDLRKLWEMKRILLTDNQYRGEIPKWIGELTYLERLDLSHNQFSGRIPTELGMLRSLQSLALHHNDLDGPIPIEFGNLEELRRLILNDNQLTGSIPERIEALALLRHLNLSNNRLTGSVPAGVSSSEVLEWMDVRENAIDQDGETFLVALPNYHNFWTKPEQLQSGGNGERRSTRLDPMQSIVMDTWAQTSELIEAPEIRSYVFELLRLLEIRRGYLRLSQRTVPEYIRIGNIREVVATLNQFLKEENSKISSPNDLERAFESVEGMTAGQATVDPFATNKPIESFHSTRKLEDGTSLHYSGSIISGIFAVWEKMREDCGTRYGEEVDCGKGILPYRTSEDF